MEALDATPRRRNKTTSVEDRKRVITAYENGVAGKDIALMLNLHRATVYSIIKKFQKTWNVEAAKRGGNRAKLLPEEAVQSIRTWIDEDCTVTLKALAEKVHERYSVRVSTSTAYALLNKREITMLHIALCISIFLGQSTAYLQIPDDIGRCDYLERDDENRPAMIRRDLAQRESLVCVPRFY